jgi:hypothetical protein
LNYASNSSDVSSFHAQWELSQVILQPFAGTDSHHGNHAQFGYNLCFRDHIGTQTRGFFIY